VNETALPRISVITPSLNQAAFLEQTIQSVISQGYPNLEYFVMDGGSTDGTIPLLKKYKASIQWVSKKDGGQSDAINKGFKIATGEILGFLNSDDVYEPGALFAVGEYFRRHPRAQWVSGKCRIIDSKGKEIRRFITLYKNIWLSLHSPIVLDVINYISQPATFWRREVSRTIGEFDQSLTHAMEYDFWLRAAQRFSLCVVPQNLARFRMHPASKAGSSARAQFDAELAIARRYVRSPVLLGLHQLHCALAIGVYKKLMADRSYLGNADRWSRPS
jgi:glycosyltransferase involved in cell wall biosynthesis